MDWMRLSDASIPQKETNHHATVLGEKPGYIVKMDSISLPEMQLWTSDTSGGITWQEHKLLSLPISSSGFPNPIRKVRTWSRILFN